MSQQPFNSDGGFSTTANIVGGNITTAGSGGDITMSGGNITGAGNITAANFFGNVHNLTTVPVTYSQLYTLATGGDLVPLTYYTITDYQTIYDQPDFYANGAPVTNPVTLTGSVEPLIVFATGVDTLDPQAYSTANGDDTIIYNIGITATEINREPTKGAITSRESSEGNLIGYDFRAVVLKRYELVSGSGIYNSYKDTGFASISNIPTFGPNCENIRLSVQDWGEGGFDDSPFRISNNVFGQYCESIVALGDFYNNTFGEVCYGMTFGHFCRNNTMGDGFANNEIGNEFAFNIIGANSIGNHIGNGFANNMIPGALTGNEISDGFANNGFVGVCANNVIGDGFAGNEIEEGFTNNYLGSNFAGTSTGINFTFNHIGDNFATKTVGANITGWNIQNNFVNSSISDDNAAYTVIESLSTTSNQILKATQGFLQATSTLSEAEYGANVDLVVTTANVNVWTFDHTGNLIIPGNIIGNGASPAPSINGFNSIGAVTLSATGNITGGNLSTGGQITSTGTGNADTGAGQIYLNGATNNRIDWAATGTGAPTTTTRSAGTKLLLYPALSGSQVDYAMGIDAATMWSSLPVDSNSFAFKWYGAETQVASLDGTGAFSAAGNVTASSLNGNANISNVTINSYTSVPKLWFKGAVSAAQNIVSSTDTVTIWNNNSDPLGWGNVSTGRITPNKAGWYEITSRVQFNTNASANSQNQINHQIAVNSNQQAISQLPNLTANVPVTMIATAMANLNGTTDYITTTSWSAIAGNAQQINGGNTAMVLVRWVST